MCAEKTESHSRLPSHTLQGRTMSSDLMQLTSQIDQMMRVIENLRGENRQLRQKIATYIQENARLQHKSERVSTQIKQVIKNMKEELV